MKKNLAIEFYFSKQLQSQCYVSTFYISQDFDTLWRIFEDYLFYRELLSMEEIILIGNTK